VCEDIENKDSTSALSAGFLYNIFFLFCKATSASASCSSAPETSRQHSDILFSFFFYNVASYIISVLVCATPDVVVDIDKAFCVWSQLPHTGTWRCHLEPERVLQRDAVEEPYLVPRRSFRTRVLLSNHFLKEFFKETIKVSQRTFKKRFFKAPFMVPQRTF